MKSSPSIALLALFSLGVLACNNTQPSSKPANPHIFSTAAPDADTAPTSPQNFDYYLLNLSWSPEFCYSHPTAVECSQHAAFVLHGLWPQNLNGGYPEDCSTSPGPSNPAQYSDIYPDPGLLAHEWKTHGTCSGLAPDAFFALARKATHSVSIPDKLSSLDHPISMPPDRIIDLFTQANPSIPASSIAISCGHNFLTAVEVCLSKSLQPIACGPIRSCRANTVRIPPPQ